MTGVEMVMNGLLSSLGIRPEEIETFKAQIPQFAANVKATVEKTQTGISSIEDRLSHLEENQSNLMVLVTELHTALMTGGTHPAPLEPEPEPPQHG